MVIPTVVSALGRVTKRIGTEIRTLEIREIIETTQTTALMGSARILRRVLET